jgi:hypothetical protein
MPFDPMGFREAVDESGGGDAPPDALYDAELVKGDVITRRADGAQWVKCSWKVIAGPHRDSQWDSLHTLDRFKPDGERNPGLTYTVGTLRSLGFPVDDVAASASVDAIKRNLLALEGGAYSVEIKTNGSFTNTYVKQRLREVAASLPGSGGDTPVYGQQRSGPSNAIMGHDGGGTSAPPQSLARAVATDVERNGQSDVTTPADVEAFDRSSAPKQGSVDPETGDEIPF